MNKKTPSEVCRETHVQACHNCDDFNCGDNLQRTQPVKCPRYPPHDLCATAKAHLAGDRGAHGCDTCEAEIAAIMARTSEILSKRLLLEKEAKRLKLLDEKNS